MTEKLNSSLTIRLSQQEKEASVDGERKISGEMLDVLRLGEFA